MFLTDTFFVKIILKKNDKKSEKIAGVWTPSCGGHHRRQGKPEDHLPEQLVRHQRQRQGRLDQCFSAFWASSPGSYITVSVKKLSQ